MHTVLCTFRDRTLAERARDQLLGAGYDRRDVHLQHRNAGGDHADDDSRAWNGTDHEIAVDRRMVDKVAGFFVHLFGQDSAAGLDRRYGDAVEQGHYVLVLDADDPAQAQRAHSLLHGIEAEDVAVVHRPEQRPVRDIVGSGDAAWRGTQSGSWEQHAHVESPERTQAAFQGRDTGEWTERAENERDRALAAGQLGEQRPLDLRDPDMDHVGLRYEDKDKPGR